MFINYLENKNTKVGQGIFTTIDIPANQPILEFHGDFYQEQDLPDPNNPYLLQIGYNSFVIPTGIAAFINHHCNPNCRLHIIGKRAILYSMYLIKAGSELNFDYSTSSTDDLNKWQMNCQCGSINCRKIISGYHLLDSATQQKMLANNMIPFFLTNQIFQ